MTPSLRPWARGAFLLVMVASATACLLVDIPFTYQAVASVMSVMRAVSVPLGITTPDQPNISSTIWVRRTTPGR